MKKPFFLLVISFYLLTSCTAKTSGLDSSVSLELKNDADALKSESAFRDIEKIESDCFDVSLSSFKSDDNYYSTLLIKDTVIEYSNVKVMILNDETSAYYFFGYQACYDLVKAEGNNNKKAISKVNYCTGIKINFKESKLASSYSVSFKSAEDSFSFKIVPTIE